MSITPDPPSWLIDRDAEYAFACAALDDRRVRLLTLTGPGGIGKSQLARAIAAALGDRYPEGVYFVEHAKMGDPDPFAARVARALGIQDGGGAPVAERPRARLAAARLLLVLDGVHDLPDAATEIAALLGKCPQGRLLVTSRAPIGIPGERVLPVPPIPAPDPRGRCSFEEIANNDAVRLLVQRTRSLVPSFTVTSANAADLAEICRRLEGVPLALELAAARLQLLSPAGLLERLTTPLEVLDPRPDHPLRRTIAWSENLLSPAARTLFRRLAVFAGGCTVASVEAVCGDPPGGWIAPSRVLDGLTELLTYGLVRRADGPDEPRFAMSETICEYALRVLETTGEAEEIQRRHAAFFLALAEDAAPQLLAPQYPLAAARLETEHENLRAALRWSLANDPEIAVRLAAALWRFWYFRGYVTEGQAWLEQALALSPGARTVARVRALNGLGVLAWTAGNLDRALALQNQSLSLAREIGDEWGVAAATLDHASVEFQRGVPAEHTRRETAEALQRFRLLGDRYGEGLALTALGDIAFCGGDLAAATTHFEEALALAQHTGHGVNLVLTLGNLAQAKRLAGDVEGAAARHREALELAAALGLQEDIIYALARVGGIAVEHQRFGRAARLLGAAASAADTLGVALQPAEQAQFDLDVATTLAALGGHAFEQAWAAGRALSIEAAVVEALAETRPTNGSIAGHDLSPREREVLRLLAAGKSDREIAEALFISKETASTHVKHVRRKLGVHSRAAAVAYAIRHDLG